MRWWRRLLVSSSKNRPWTLCISMWNDQNWECTCPTPLPISIYLCICKSMETLVSEFHPVLSTNSVFFLVEMTVVTKLRRYVPHPIQSSSDWLGIVWHPLNMHIYELMETSASQFHLILSTNGVYSMLKWIFSLNWECIHPILCPHCQQPHAYFTGL